MDVAAKASGADICRLGSLEKHEISLTHLLAQPTYVFRQLSVDVCLCDLHYWPCQLHSKSSLID